MHKIHLFVGHAIHFRIALLTVFFLFAFSLNAQKMPSNEFTGASTATCDPAATFCNKALEVGLEDGGTAYGRGAAALDIDNDGDIDIFISDSGSPRTDHPYASRVFLNDGTGNFTVVDLEDDWGIDSANMRYTFQGLWFDSDNDGDSDLLLVNGGYGFSVESLAFYLNDLNVSGTFIEHTAASNITLDKEYWWSATAADFDKDGLLDIAITSRNRFAYDPAFAGDTLNAILLYQNLGNNEFVEISETVGLPNPIGDNKNLSVLDYDRDGCLDLLTSKWEYDPALFPSLGGGVKLFKNTGCGTAFTEVSLGLNPAIPPIGAPEWLAFAVASFDYDQDGWQDIYMGRFERQDYILRNNHDGTFTKLDSEIGLDMGIGFGTVYDTTALGWLNDQVENTMGLLVDDFQNNDGYPDVAIGTGHPFHPGDAIVYCHQGSSLDFDRCSDDFVIGHGLARNHGACTADFDGDGDIDLLWNLGGLATLGDGELHFDTLGNPVWWPTDDFPGYYENQSADTSTYPTAFVKLTGTVSNREAIGARIRIEFINSVGATENRYLWRESADAFMSQNSEWLPIPLGPAPSGTATLFIEWPSGLLTNNYPVTAGDRVEIFETTVAAESGLARPDFKLWPNPAKDQLFVEMPVGIGEIDIRIVDVLGSTVGEWVGVEGNDAGRFTVDLGGLGRGVYFVRMQIEGKGLVTKKIVVQN